MPIRARARAVHVVKLQLGHGQLFLRIAQLGLPGEAGIAHQLVRHHHPQALHLGVGQEFGANLCHAQPVVVGVDGGHALAHFARTLAQPDRLDGLDAVGLDVERQCVRR